MTHYKHDDILILLSNADRGVDDIHNWVSIYTVDGSIDDILVLQSTRPSRYQMITLIFGHLLLTMVFMSYC